MLCEYGCGKESIYTLKNNKRCCSDNWRRCESVRRKNSMGLKRAYSEGRGKVDYHSLPLETKKRMSRFYHFLEIPWDQLKDNGYKKKRLIYEEGYKCSICKLEKWIGQPISLEIDHIDGNNQNWKRENLRLLCPNCHAQTPTYRGRNVNSGFNKVSDLKILQASKENKNIRQTLLSVGLTPKGNNYSRVKKLLNSK